ncbi:MAG: amino acid adenylation domain-containing protein, partial [Steroidobacteraceae bacterium]
MKRMPKQLDDATVEAVSLPLSTAQTEVWLAQRLAPMDVLFNIGGYVDIRGPVDPGTFMAALRAALQEAGSPLARFRETSAGVQQLPGDACDAPILFLDLMGEADPHAAALTWMATDFVRPFDLTQGLLCRFSLLQVAADRVLWYSAYHHLVTDFFGAQLLNQRTADLYGAVVGGRAAPPATLTPWPEAVRDELEYDDCDRFQRDRSYWNERLRSLPEPATLSGRPPAWPQSTLSIGAVVRGATMTRLEELGVASGSSLAAVIVAAAALYLWRVTGERDLILGMPVDARTTVRLRHSTAFLANVIPLRLAVDPAGSATQLVRHCGARIREALGHQRYRSSTLRSDLGVAPNKPNLHGLMINFLPDGVPCHFSGRPARLHAFAQSAGVQDFSITVRARSDLSDASVQFDANAASYDRVALEAHARNFLTLLEMLPERPQAPAWRLPMMGEQERQRALGEWRGTDLPPADRTVIALFEAQAQRTPQAHAVIRDEQYLTYGELDARASQVARRLIDAGVGRGHVVAVWADRTFEMVIAVLAAWKAGAAYLPLDPSHPRERVRLILAEARPVRLLSGKASAHEARESCGIGSVEEVDLTEPMTGDVNVTASAGKLVDPAYVIYTSGSSGAPKGVVVRQTGLAALAAAHATHLKVGAQSRVLQLAALTFDVSVAEMLSALTQGAALVLAPAEALGGDELRNLLVKQRVTHALMTPTVLATLKRAPDLPLECLVVGGEVCSPALIEEWSTGLRMINAYGPTESTVCATLSEPLRPGEAVSLGRPIPGTRVHVLDAGLEPVPCGVAGELYIGGVGVAAGYLNRPALTAERFVADPYGPPGSRLYRSGDRVRWRGDGALEYLGRTDDQVKIRGQRLELQEIEAQLARHGQVREAAVVAREDVPGDKRLVAYVTARAASVRPSAEELRAHLQGVLPKYMVPSVFVVLDEMPLTAGGKLDRRSLRAPVPSARVPRAYEAPRGEVEELLAGIWQELLQVQRVSRNDNFFELGGHSLLIVQMMERLRRVGLAPAVSQVFESPTLADLAAVALWGRTDEVEVPPNLIPPGSRRITPEMLPLVELESEHIERIVRAVPGGAANVQDIYPLVPLQEGMLFHHLLDGQRGDTYVLPMLLTLPSRAKLEEWIGALQWVIDRHDILRTAMLWEQLPRPLQVVYRRASLPVEEVRLTADRDPLEQLKERMAPELQSLDLRQAPLMRLQIACAADGVHWHALLQLHHLLCDHESLELLLTEVIAKLHGESAELPPPLPYRVHVAQSLAHARQRDDEVFFRGKLADVDEPTAPFGMLEVLGHGSQVNEVTETLDPALTSRVRAVARQLGVGAATLFHAVWGLVLARTSGRDDVVFGDVLMTRLQGSAGAQRIMGMFINTLPLRLRLRDVTAVELVKQTQREIVELLGHEQASLAMAQRCSGVAQPTPLFSGILNYRRSSADWSRDPRLPPVYIVTRGWTNYPLMLSVDERAEEFVLELSVALRTDAARMLDYVRTALRSLVEALEGASRAPVLTLPVLPADERRRVIEEFNATACDYRREKLIHELFEEQARRMPDAVAVEHELRQLTYSQLNHRANQLARYLASLGVAPGEIVGICLERGPEMIVGLLGILKAGAAYLPLDPSHPAERLRQMVQDAAPRVVLTETPLLGVLPVGEATAEMKMIALDAQQREIGGLSGEDLAVTELAATSESLVYVIYTSGSTGRPKGTAMRHRSVVNLIEWHRRSLGAAEARRVLQFAALSFDVAFQEIFSTLCAGGTLVLLDEWVRRDPKALLELLSSRSIHRLFITPVMLQSIAEYGRGAEPVAGSLEDVITAGEQLRVSPEIRGFFARLPGCRLHNHYGPTETHVVTALTLAANPQQWPELPAIGRPIANIQVYVLDRQMQPVPIGASGELYIGGANVARGYLNRPDLTAERFIADPYGTDPQARLYKTGDLGRWRADGTLEYLGRNDDQVKLRGFRIELGEIEARLARHSQVREVAVIVREVVAGEKRLVAYFTAREAGLRPSAGELRTYLKGVLPEYMVPSAFVALDALPLTPSGKLDRRALPAPAAQPQA